MSSKCQCLTHASAVPQQHNWAGDSVGNLKAMQCLVILAYIYFMKVWDKRQVSLSSKCILNKNSECVK